MYVNISKTRCSSESNDGSKIPGSNPTMSHGEVLCQLGLESYILAWHTRVLPKYIDLFMYGSSDFISTKFSFLLLSSTEKMHKLYFMQV